MKDLPPLKYFLGIEVYRTAKGFHLSQTRYIKGLVLRADMAQSKAVSTPMATTFVSTTDESPPFQDALKYRSIVGDLQYLAFTCPDISFAVNRLCQHMHHPLEKHWQGVKRVLRYLNSTATMQFLLSSAPGIILSTFTDADWASDPIHQRLLCLP